MAHACIESRYHGVVAGCGILPPPSLVERRVSDQRDLCDNVSPCERCDPDQNPAGMVRHRFVLPALTAMAAAGCRPGCDGDLPPDSVAAAAGVSAEHIFPLGREAVDGLTFRASGWTVMLAWHSGGAWRGVKTADSARTFEPASAAELVASGSAQAVPPPTVMRLDDETWQLSGRGAWSPYGDWTATLPALAPSIAPVAVDEPCGLVAVVTAERGPAGVDLVLRRYLPPSRRRGGAGSQVGMEIELGRARALSRQPVIVPLLQAAVVAWQDRAAVHAVRVELPAVLCRGNLGSQGR